MKTSFLEEQFGFVNKVKQPTRGNSFLDQIWIDDGLAALYNEKARIEAPIKNSDHSSIFLSARTCVRTEFEERKGTLVWDFRESNLNEYLQCVSHVNFHFPDPQACVDELLRYFYSVLLPCVSVIPCSKVSITKRRETSRGLLQSSNHLLRSVGLRSDVEIGRGSTISREK